MRPGALIFRTAGSLALAAALLGPGATASLDGAEADAEAAASASRARARAAARALRSTVEVRAGGAPAGERSGAGIVVDARGLVLTALHVADGAATLLVRTADGTEHAAQLHAKDPLADLALLRLLTPGLELAAAEIADDSRLEVGESVLAVGNPFGLYGSVSAGILSGRGRRGILDDKVPLLQTDAAVHPGCSGGPLVNLRGEVVGLLTAILHDRGVDLPIAFAVPSGEILRVLPFLERGEAYERPWIGVRIGRRGGALVVLEVMRRGPGDRAGLREGDLLERLGGRTVGSLDEFRALLGLHPIGGSVPVVVKRGEERIETEIVVASIP